MVERMGWSLSLVAAVLLIGCAHMHKGKAPEIKEEWLARVPPSQMQPVDAARADLRQAKNDQNRAQVGLQDAENRHDIAKSEVATAKDRVKAAEKRVKMAKDTGDAGRLQTAESELNQPQARLTAAEAKADWADANQDAAKARVDYADAAVRTQEAKVSQAEYQVLANANDTRVKDFQPQSFEAAVSQRQAEEAKARNEVRDKEQKVASAYQKWNQARSQVEGQQPTG
jgi:chromosome segregation ATPase